MTDPETAKDLDDSTSPLGRIRSMLPRLRRSDARVATVLLERADRVGHLSVTDVAALAEVSESTVVRACQRLGFRGYHDAKRSLASVTSQDDDLYEEVTETDSSAAVLEKVVAASARTLHGGLSTLDRNAFTEAVRKLATARHVLVIGVGPSSPVAQDAAYRLRLVGRGVDAPVDSLTQHLAAGLLVEGDACLVISHTGATQETLVSARAARESGATVVAITSFARSPLTEIAHHSLVSGGEGSGVRVEAMASRLTHLAVVDAIYVDLALRHTDDSTTALARSRDVATDHQL